MTPQNLLLAASFFLLIACNPRNNSSVPELDSLSEGFQSPQDEYKPETWFHINGNNLSREGITLDLEAIHKAGLRGIQLFNKNGNPYPGVTQVDILSPEWMEIIAHAAKECKRLGLTFTLQNCPGWSQAGGPWVPAEEAQRELVQSIVHVSERSPFQGAVPLKEEYLGEDYDYKDICVMAFPTPVDDATPPFVPVRIQTNNPQIPWETIFDPEQSLKLPSKGFQGIIRNHPEYTVSKLDMEDSYVQLLFKEDVTLRSLRLPPIRTMVVGNQYPRVDIQLLIQKVEGDQLTTVAEVALPHSCWPDSQYDLTLALPEFTAREIRITFKGKHDLFLSHLYLQSQTRLHNWEAKAAFAMRSLEQEVNHGYQKEYFLNPDSIIDLTDHVDTLGHLDWKVPEGSWTLVRFGHVNMRVTNGPAVPEATGWECSKLDKLALENHLRKGMVGDLAGPGGPMGEGNLYGLLIDSWERMIPTWTIKSETLFEEFRARRGYDLHPYLPALMGYVVKDLNHTEKFHRDLRQTMDDLFIENFFAHFRTIAREFGAVVYTEGATGEVLPGDALRYYGVSDVPMTEFWYPRPPAAQTMDAKPIKYAASASHLYDKKLVAAEACTQVPVTWNEHPFSVKYLIDKNFALGVNHLVFHTFSHTPQREVYPGSSFGSFVGFPLVRNQTWWHHMPDWLEYLSRCQYMLQQGEYVADVLWYLGDELERPPFQTSPFPEGFQYDLLNPEILHSQLSVQNGRLQVKDGGNYKLILLRNSQRMLRSTAERIQELVKAGAVILGDKPLDSPSLMDRPEDLEVLHKIADKLWGPEPSGFKKVGKGKVYWGKSLNEVLELEAMKADVNLPIGLDVPWIHRHTKDAEIYFLSNQYDQALDASIGFRSTGKSPEIWDPMTGKQQAAGVWQQKEGKTFVALRFEPHGSQIVVFRKNNKQAACMQVEKNGEVLIECSPGWFQLHEPDRPVPSFRVGSESLVAHVAGDYLLRSKDGSEKTVSFETSSQSLNEHWEIAFEEGWETPASLELAELMPLNNHPLPAVRYYSGTVSYQKEFQVSDLSEINTLDLGEVAYMAEVWCNGKKLGTRWAPPFVFDLTAQVHTGTNSLEIKVTNTWRNQLIYDLKRNDSEKKTWTTNPPDNPDEVPALAGLIGPVLFIQGDQIQIDND